MIKQALFWVIALLVVAGVIAVIAMQNGSPEEPEENGTDPANGEEELSVAEDLLETLPHETTIEGRAVVFDRDTVEEESRDEYAELPYEVDIGDETRLVEGQTPPEPGYTPISFVEHFLENTVPPQEELDMYGEDMYQYSVSLYPLDEDTASQYPADDGETDQMAEEGVSAYVRAMNFPDDSIGGNEQRFDFIVTSEGGWVLVWHGERNFCRRMDQEFWQPANELCP